MCLVTFELVLEVESLELSLMLVMGDWELVLGVGEALVPFEDLVVLGVLSTA